MDPTLIAAAARLCGWTKTDGGWLVAGRTCMTEPERPEELTDAGLLALTQELVKLTWIPEWDEDLGWIWKHRGYAKHKDYATAACLAAQQEVGDE